MYNINLNQQMIHLLYPKTPPPMDSRRQVMCNFFFCSFSIQCDSASSLSLHEKKIRFEFECVFNLKSLNLNLNTQNKCNKKTTSKLKRNVLLSTPYFSQLIIIRALSNSTLIQVCVYSVFKNNYTYCLSSNSWAVIKS